MSDIVLWHVDGSTHDFRALVTTYQGDHGPENRVDFYCTRCLLQLSGPQANEYHRAIYGRGLAELS